MARNTRGHRRHTTDKCIQRARRDWRMLREEIESFDAPMIVRYECPLCGGDHPKAECTVPKVLEAAKALACPLCGELHKRSACPYYRIQRL